MHTEYTIVRRVPLLEEYRRLVAAVGWTGVMNMDAAPAALSASLCGAVALHRDTVIGMGRVVGDGAIFFYLQDIAVDPAHQHHGVGSNIVEALLAEVRAIAPPQAFIGLFAAEGTLPFYERFGFMTHPALTGMFQTTGL